MTSYARYWGLYCGDEEETPHSWSWKRWVYERVFHPVWPLLLTSLEPVVPDGRYAVDMVLARVPQSAEALADRTPPEDQETFLWLAHLAADGLVSERQEMTTVAMQ
jgi:hypothetical protein